jgi:hypothetical protein
MSYIGVPPFGQTARTVTPFIATESQTVFTPTGGYIVNYIDVYYNGVKLVNGDDYVATNGTSVTLTVAANAGDTIETMVYMPVSLTDTYRTGEVDAGFVGKTSSTGAALMPVGTSEQRPIVPQVGMIRMNVSTGVPEWYDNSTSDWVPFSEGAVSYQVDYLVVAGGGGGGGRYMGGGGGGGGALSSTHLVSKTQTYSIIVGASGAGAAGESLRGSNGGVSSAFTSTTIGGGGGGSYNAALSNGLSGGSGGGSSGYNTGVTGLGTIGQGNNGGIGGVYGAGGGGGYNSVGGNGTSQNGGAGGTGIMWGGANYAGGGGGGAYQGIGGSASFGGGVGASHTGAPQNGITNSGGGGGGGNGYGASTGGGNGGSGVVIIRYLGPQRATGGTVTSANGYTIHTFTSSGTFTA